MQINLLEPEMVELSEIEKYCCLYVFNCPGVKESFLDAQFGPFQDFLKKICHGLIRKGILKMDPVLGALYLTDGYDGLDLAELEPFSDLTVVDSTCQKFGSAS